MLAQSVKQQVAMCTCRATKPSYVLHIAFSNASAADTLQDLGRDSLQVC